MRQFQKRQAQKILSFPSHTFPSHTFPDLPSPNLLFPKRRYSLPLFHRLCVWVTVGLLTGIFWLADASQWSYSSAVWAQGLVATPSDAPSQVTPQEKAASNGVLDDALSQNAVTRYQERRLHNPDGIGKIYLGREIAQVMGHQGAGWLERASRQREEQPEKAIAALPLKPTDTVADIGAGTGYFSFRLSRRVPQGKVLAVDVQPEMIDILNLLKQKFGTTNLQPVLGSETDPNLPENSVDLALMVDAYHEFAYPYEMMRGVVRSLKPAGRVVLLEYRGENPLIPIKGLHKMTQAQVKKEMAAVGLTWQTTEEFLPSQHLFIFQKSPEPVL